MVILVSLLTIACLICDLTLKVYIFSSLHQFVSTVCHYFAGKMAQIFKLMIWKIFVLRKRRWFVSALEVVIPIIMFWLLVFFKNLMPENSQSIVYEKYPMKYDEIALVYNMSRANIAYTPSNNVTDSIMTYVYSMLTFYSNGKI